MFCYEWLENERLRQLLIIDEIYLKGLYEKYREHFTDELAFILALMDTRSEKHFKKILSMVTELEAIKKLLEYIRCVESTRRVLECWENSGTVVVRWNDNVFYARNNVEAILLARYLAKTKGGNIVVENIDRDQY